MTIRLRKFAVPIATAVVLAFNGAAYAGTQQQSPDKPVDCKKTSDHKDCKDK